MVGLDDVVTACRGLGGLRCPVHIYGRGDVMATAPLVQTLKGTKSLEDEDEKSRGRAGLSRFWFTVHTVDNYILCIITRTRRLTQTSREEERTAGL